MSRDRALSLFEGETITGIGISPDDGALWLLTRGGMLVADVDDLRTYQARRADEEIQPNQTEASRQEREVPAEVINYEAAAREIGGIVQGVLKRSPTPKHAGIDSTLEGHWAGRIIGAALGKGKP